MADLYGACITTGKIVKWTYFSSTVNASFSLTSALCVTFDGTDVIYSANANSVKKGTGFSATVQSSFNFPGGGEPYDLHWTSSTALYAVANSSKFYQLNGFSATVSASFTSGTNLRGAAWDGTNALGTNIPPASNYFFYKFSGFSSTVTASFDNGSNSARGAAWDGTNFVGVQHTNAAGGMKQYNGFTNSVLSSFSTSGLGVFGIYYYAATPAGPTTVKTWDGVTQSTGIKTYFGVPVANTKSVNGAT